MKIPSSEMIRETSILITKKIDTLLIKILQNKMPINQSIMEIFAHKNQPKCQLSNLITKTEKFNFIFIIV